MPSLGIDGQCPHKFGQNPDMCDQCWADADNWSEIGDLVDTADSAIGAALIAAYKAARAITELRSSRVYDIELAEGSDGEDAVAEMNRATLSLRHAQRIIAAHKRDLDEQEAQPAGRPARYPLSSLAQWTEYICMGCGAYYMALPWTTDPHECWGMARQPGE